jgi:putative glutamine amidotransferase
MPKSKSSPLGWIGIPVRAFLITFLFTLLSFAIALLLSILGTIVYSQIRHVAPNLAFAYRHIAFPFAIIVGATVFVISFVIETRNYRRRERLNRMATLSDPTALRIAIPLPHSGDRDYAERAIPQYENAVRGAGGEPIRIGYDQPAQEIAKTLARCDAVLLPGSRADVDPQKYNAVRHEKTAAADEKRDTLDRLLLDAAYRERKPILGICYGLQSLNVYRSGSLVQHIESRINHSPDRKVANAHTVKIDPDSRLAKIVGSSDGQPIAVNSSHHQSAEVAGDGLRIVAHSPEDGVVEALEGTAPDHFVLAVQWHPERSVNDGPEVSQSAQAIFRAFVDAARAERNRN